MFSEWPIVHRATQINLFRPFSTPAWVLANCWNIIDNHCVLFIAFNGAYCLRKQESQNQQHNQFFFHTVRYPWIDRNLLFFLEQVRVLPFVYIFFFDTSCLFNSHNFCWYHDWAYCQISHVSLKYNRYARFFPMIFAHWFDTVVHSQQCSANGHFYILLNLINSIVDLIDFNKTLLLMLVLRAIQLFFHLPSPSPFCQSATHYPLHQHKLRWKVCKDKYYLFLFFSLLFHSLALCLRSSLSFSLSLSLSTFSTSRLNQ